MIEVMGISSRMTSVSVIHQGFYASNDLWLVFPLEHLRTSGFLPGLPWKCKLFFGNFNVFL